MPRPRAPWSRISPDPPEPRPLGRVRLFAVLGAWMEGDVIEACVRNAFTQGCEAVHLVDNDSPDDTVERALAAGAVLARSFSTQVYDEALRMRLMHEVVDEVSVDLGEDHVWWLWLDADEFPHGAGGRTVRDQLETLDRRYRVVGARYLNHYPTALPHHLEGRHPLDVQPDCEELPLAMCAVGHRKHPLVRWDRNGPPIEVGAGFHRARSALTLLEPPVGIFVHHFPFREESTSRKRLELLCGGGRARPGDPATGHMLPRFRSLDAVYRGDWDRVENFMPGREERGVALRPWTELVAPADRRVARWYPSGPEPSARSGGGGGRDGTAPGTGPAGPTTDRRWEPPRLVTVVIPVRNGAGTLPAQLAALANQSYAGRWELVVADNGSTDDTVAVVRRWAHLLPGTRVVDASDRPGSSHARNVGAREARGELLAFCDADDVVAPTWLAALVDAARDADLVGGTQDATLLNTVRARATRGARSLPGRVRPLGFLPFAPTSNLAVWTEVYRALGGLDERYPQAHDIEFSWRAQLAGYTLGRADEAVVHYRYRTTARAIARQAYWSGWDEAHLFRDYHARGARRTPPGRVARRWAAVLTGLPALRRPAARRTWIRAAAHTAGRLAGSAHFRTLLP